MIGRAGRIGFSAKGKSYIVLKNMNEVNQFLQLFREDQKICVSQLMVKENFLKFTLNSICLNVISIYA